MNNIKIGKTEMSIGDLLIYLGALVAIIAIFLTYVESTMFPNNTTTLTGLDIITGKDEDVDEDEDELLSLISELDLNKRPPFSMRSDPGTE